METKQKQIRLKQLIESHCIEADFFPVFQRFLYEASNVYTVTVDLDGKVLAPSCFAEEEEGEYVESLLTTELLEEAVSLARNNFLEDIIPIELAEKEAVCQGILLKVDGTPDGVLCVLGFFDENEENPERPKDIRTTQRERYEWLLRGVQRQLITRLKAAVYAYEATLNAVNARAAESRMESDYMRNAIITEIVQMLESEEEITDVVENIFEKVCSHQRIDVGILYRIDDGQIATRISQWFAGEERRYPMLPQIPVEEHPFMRADNFIISANTALRPAQKEFMSRMHYKAVIVMPIYMQQDIIMYMEFGCYDEQRIWEMDTVRFLSDVRKIVQSIIAKRVTQNSLSSSLSTLEDIMENIGCGLLVVEPQRRELLFTNHLLTPELHHCLKEIDFRTLFHEENQETEYYIHNLDVWLLITRSKATWVDGSCVELYTYYDITQNKINEKRIEKSSNSDFLTGLYNRMRCEQDLRSILNNTLLKGGNGALLFVDLDDFKHINEGLGHQYGDALLKAISDNLRRISGIESTCYRVGGDEFIVIVTHQQYKRLETIIESIREIFSHPWYLKGDDYYCTMSMGVCMFPRDGKTVEEVIRNADAALLEAKNLGKNCVKFYSTGNETDSRKRLDMEKYMRDACARPEDEFEVYYQPIVDIAKAGNPCVGAEALVRWNSKGMGNVQPSDFIPLAEYLGLIKPIGAYVMREACRACKHWNDMGHPDYKVNVNLSVVQLLQCDMENQILSVLRETGLSPHNLTVEVTESLAINDMAYMKKILTQIRRLGVRVALDDFGTGYSSLNHIHEMPIDIIKVDRCFVENVGEEAYSEVFIRAISELAKAMNLNVCVEGVEDDIQYGILKKHGVNMIQGYYFAEPMPREEFEAKFVD
ncbi:diguanylate cyclase (GGDEF) domain-containing protein [Lachnospiraceae bacterium XBB1006]|nr:diguanylate cyclase (GGDEF) domain-containing protein [Lachnospiraceae bacterium XBB1006]